MGHTLEGSVHTGISEPAPAVSTERVGTSITDAVVDFIDGARLERMPADALAIGKRCIVDALGVVLAGSTAPGARILFDYHADSGLRADATVFSPKPLRTSAAVAALLNGISGHALDFDDTQLSTTADRIFGLLTHPTVPPLVAGLAVAEREGVSGARFLEAFLTGFEVECKIAEAIHPDHYKKGFHSSGTVGTFGAAVAVSKLLGLDRTQTAHALAIAASTASGIRVNFGSMTKPLHVGRAAHNGLVAAELAGRGFTGGGDALDPPWGFLQVFSHGQGFDRDRIAGVLGAPYTIVSPGVSIKPYPCGVLGHPMMDAMKRLVVAHDLQPDQVSRIRVRAGSNILNPLRYPIARNELEAKFCPAFMVSSILLRRKAGIHEFTDEFVLSAPVQEMMTRVERVLDPEIEARGYDKIRARVEVVLHSGVTLAEDADERYRGGPDNPFTPADLEEKFTDCARLVLSDERIGEVLRLVDGVDGLPNVAPLCRALAAS
jgi:2-methylcitrate dehydratase PrpD